ncbi:MAG: hypothetical protein HQL93_06205, partial [Magnetococcales bacterium]|nr:hypothetical protein [Magnetococcales bacterium]
MLQESCYQGGCDLPVNIIVEIVKCLVPEGYRKIGVCQKRDECIGHGFTGFAKQGGQFIEVMFFGIEYTKQT